jgi:D-alanyl-D-alanine carboxypeptidase
VRERLRRRQSDRHGWTTGRVRISALLRDALGQRATLRGLCCVVVALVALALGGAAEAGAASGPQPGSEAALASTLRSQLSQYLKTRTQAEHISAISLRVSLPGEAPSINVAVGTTRFGGGPPISTGAIWQIGSNTKAFTSVILLQLEAQGRVSINDTLGKWLPQYPAWRDITIRQLLTMTSGIPSYDDQTTFEKAFAADPEGTFTTQQLVSYAYKLPLEQGWNYSNTNYILAQMIIEKITHDSYADQLTERIIKPLGLRDLCVAPYSCSKTVSNAMPDGYFTGNGGTPLAPLDGTPAPKLALTWAQGAGGIVSSLADLTSWDQALYGGRMLPQKQQQELESVVSESTGEPDPTPAPGTAAFGLGVQLTNTSTSGAIWDYEGETGGYRLLHVYQPASRVVFAIAMNSGAVGDTDQLGTLGNSVFQTLQAAGVLRQ